MALVLNGQRRELKRDQRGDLELFVPDLRPGARYHYVIGDDDYPLPDPASLWQPEGPHEDSEVLDLSTFLWTDHDRPGVTLAGQVLYELHVGTFTRQGTWQAAAERLPALRELGVTCIELMPVADFPGRFGWGYDGVHLHAPYHGYGTPRDLAAFIDRAHALGLGVILDVVYNHLGPDGNYVPRFIPDFFSKVQNDWGNGLNYEVQAVRDLMIDNAVMWIRDYHLDGLRLDATQDIHDGSPRHIIAELVAAAREAAGKRPIVVIAENEPQAASLVRTDGCDALWNDDFHHSAMVAATGQAEAYYSDTRGTPQELISALRWGYLYQGQYYAWQDQPRGEPALDLPATAFVTYIQNHDQVANSAKGLRLDRRTSPGRARALQALMLLAPGTPMLFQGQEWAASSPFHYFADHQKELAELVRKGRREFLTQFPSLNDPAVQRVLVDPEAEATFRESQLDWEERERGEHGQALAMTRELLRLRREDQVLRLQRAERMFGSVLGPEAFLLRHVNAPGDRLILCNLGADLELLRCPEPLIAPPAGCRWSIRFSTEDPAFGGGGTPPIDVAGEPLLLPGHSLIFLEPAGEAP